MRERKRSCEQKRSCRMSTYKERREKRKAIRDPFTLSFPSASSGNAAVASAAVTRRKKSLWSSYNCLHSVSLTACRSGGCNFGFAVKILCRACYVAHVCILIAFFRLFAFSVFFFSLESSSVNTVKEKKELQAARFFLDGGSSRPYNSLCSCSSARRLRAPR